jgi:tetratricopeptide (TPR) repeat protein
MRRIGILFACSVAVVLCGTPAWGQAGGQPPRLRTGVERGKTEDDGQPAVPHGYLGVGQDEEDSAIRYWLEHGHRKLAAKEYDEAEYAFRQALVIDPKDRSARFGLGTTYIQMQRYREALGILEPMTEEFPADYTLKNNVAWLYATAADHSVRNGEKAVALAQDALFARPYDYHVWSTLAEAHYVSGDYEKALRAAEEALKLARQDSHTAKHDLQEYERQVAKCRKAAAAMSLIE